MVGQTVDYAIAANVSTRREPWLDVAKGVSILSVVLFHAGSLAPPETLAGKVWQLIDLGLFTFIMPLFFLISGLFMSKNLTLPMGRFLKARVWPMAYLFLLWAVIWALIDAATGGIIGNDLLTSLTLQSILWYLAALALYMTIARLLVHLPTGPLVSGAAVLALPFALWLPFDGWGLSHTPHFMVFFLIGVRFRATVVRFISRPRRRDVLSLVGAGVLLGLVAKFVPEGPTVAYAFAPLVALPLVLFLSRAITGLGIISSGLSILGRTTLPVFLLHPLLLAGSAWMTPEVLAENKLIVWVLPLVVTASAVTGALAIWLLLRRLPGLFQWPTSVGRGKDVLGQHGVDAR